MIHFLKGSYNTDTILNTILNKNSVFKAHWAAMREWNHFSATETAGGSSIVSNGNGTDPFGRVGAGITTMIR